MRSKRHAAQEAPWLELLALVELCKHEGAKAKDRQALAALVDRLPEAGDTDAVAQARALTPRRKGGVDLAHLNSLICTCLLNGVEPYGYLRQLLARFAHPSDRLEELSHGQDALSRPRELCEPALVKDAHIREASTNCDRTATVR